MTGCAVLGLGTYAAPAFGTFLQGRVIDPAPPMLIESDDAVTLFATSGFDVFTDGSQLYESSVTRDGNDLTWEIQTSPGGVGFQIFTPMSDSVTLDPLGPGTYRVYVFWQHNDEFGLPSGTLGPTEGFGEFTFRVFQNNGLSGDFDNDGVVGQGDLNLALLNWGAAAELASVAWLNDPPSDEVGQDELNRVLLNWGNGSGPAAAVPEPTGALALLAVVGWMSRRCRG